MLPMILVLPLLLVGCMTQQQLEEVYNRGVEYGRGVGYAEGYAQGYTDGYSPGYEQGYEQGYAQGYAKGYAEGWNAAIKELKVE